jgi:hypothetical protein
MGNYYFLYYASINLRRVASPLGMVESGVTEIDLESVSHVLDPIYLLPLPSLTLTLETLAIPPRLLPTSDFLDGLSDSQRANTLRMCILCWKASNYTIVPRQYQIEATLALLDGRDSLVDVTTGWEKTLCMILPVFMDPTSISVVISPLCRLQMLQLEEFTKWGLRAISINHDTPKDDELYRVSLFSLFHHILSSVGYSPWQIQHYSNTA